MKTKYKHFEFYETVFSENRKDEIWQCSSVEDMDLGIVYFDKVWRQWIWEQNPDIKMSRSCLLDVGDFLRQLNTTKKSAEVG